MELKVYRFGLDYVRVNFSGEFRGSVFKNLFHGLSDNSNENFNLHLWGHIFKGTLISNPQKDILLLDYYGDTVLEICKIKDGGIVKKLAWTVTFYSAYFYIEEIQDIFLGILTRYEEFIDVSRVDLALDTNIPVGEWWDYHQTRMQKKQQITNAGVIETFYLGGKKNNKKHFIRVYDKKLDSLKKGKFHLFSWLLKKDTATRVELQMNIISCKNYGITTSTLINHAKYISVHEVFNTSPLFIPFLSCTRNPSGTYLPQLKELEGKTQEFDIIKVKKAIGQETIEILPYAKVMLGYAKKLNAHGYDVVSYLKQHLWSVDAQIEHDISFFRTSYVKAQGVIPLAG